MNNSQLGFLLFQASIAGKNVAEGSYLIFHQWEKARDKFEIARKAIDEILEYKFQ